MTQLSRSFLQETYPLHCKSRHFLNLSQHAQLRAKPNGVMIIDATRRGGIESPAYLDVLRWHTMFNFKDHYENIVLIFWGKFPKRLAAQYKQAIAYLRSMGVTVLCFITHNYYYYPIEPHVTYEEQELDQLLECLGTPDALRLRFDPIILGTDPQGKEIPNIEHFGKLCEKAEKYGIKHIVFNFLVPSYKNTGNKLACMGYQIRTPQTDEVHSLLSQMLILKPQHLYLRGCAETADLATSFPEILPSGCADPNWAKSVNQKLTTRPFIGHHSREGCGCVYAGDIGIYPQYVKNTTKDGVSFTAMENIPCPGGCVYCYAQWKNNPDVYYAQNHCTGNCRLCKLHQS